MPENKNAADCIFFFFLKRELGEKSETLHLQLSWWVEATRNLTFYIIANYALLVHNVTKLMVRCLHLTSHYVISLDDYYYHVKRLNRNYL